MGNLDCAIQFGGTSDCGGVPWPGTGASVQERVAQSKCRMAAGDIDDGKPLASVRHHARLGPARTAAVEMQ